MLNIFSETQFSAYDRTVKAAVAELNVRENLDLDVNTFLESSMLEDELVDAYNTYFGADEADTLRDDLIRAWGLDNQRMAA